MPVGAATATVTAWPSAAAVATVSVTEPAPKRLPLQPFRADPHASRSAKVVPSLAMRSSSGAGCHHAPWRSW